MRWIKLIKIDKNLEDIPEKLTNKSTKQAFDVHISEGKYSDENNDRRYTSSGIRNKLNAIYNNKCAYCEKKVLDAEISIEHYRPKSIYYWLSYSWDNLLFCCQTCNQNKGNNFDIKNDKVNYNGESFINIHNLGIKYNKIEEPFIINPEIDDIVNEIDFDKSGQISSKNEKIDKTIKIIKLYRKELIDIRLVIINNFINEIQEKYLIAKKKRNSSELTKYINNFVKKINNKQEHYSLNNFIAKCPDIFFDNETIKIIVKAIFEKTTIRD